MNYSFKGFILLLGVFVFGAFYPINDEREKEAMILHAVLNYLEVLHFDPKPIDDEFGAAVYDNYITDLDPSKRFLTQKDLDYLSPFKDKIDDQIRLRTFDFFEKSVEILDQSYVRAEIVFNDVITRSFDFTKDENIELDYEKRVHPADDMELKEFWRKYIKYDILNKTYNKMKRQEEKQKEMESNEANGEVEPLEIKTFNEYVEESRLEVKENYEDWFGRLKKLRRSDRFESYINSITHLFDPHSDYYNPKEKEDFDIRMGGKLEGIGARLTTEDDLTKVTSIVPGGPAYKAGELEADDFILAATQEDGEKTEFTGLRLDDVVQKIRGPKGTIVILTIKKKDGTILDISIERDEVIIDEGFAKSLIMNTDEGEKIGYIRLPRFYSSFEGNNGNSCAKDVEKELEKLKAENVEGVVLDLRNNGGGSLRDVITMSGLFIEKGPIVQVKPRNKDPKVYKDTDSGVVYDGPLVVMVNSYSASASEILAAALQDYGRAVIVGSNSTFGKGTVQRFFSLDEAFSKVELNNQKLGELKVTMQKFYRVNGGSTQLKGVIPDIVLPDNFHFIELGEKDYDHALDWSNIKAVKYDQEVFRVDGLNSVVDKSKARVSADPEFNKILESAKLLKVNRDYSSFSLNYDSFEEYWEAREKENEQFEDFLETDLETFSIENLGVDLELINSDEGRKARNQDFVDGLSKDVYVEEVLNILSDIKS